LGSCKISLKGASERERCYDVASPFILQYHRYECNNHGGSFSLLELDLHAHHVTPQIVVFDRTIVTTKLVEYVFNTIPDHSFNFSALTRTIISGWVTTLTHKIHVVSVNFTLYST